MAKRRRSAYIEPMGPSETTHSLEARKIENGYILRHLESGPKGYKSREIYHEKLPEGIEAVIGGNGEGKGIDRHGLRKMREAESHKVKDT